MKILIKNGRVIDPYNNIDGIFDILIENKSLVKLEKNIICNVDKVINAENYWVVPGLIDLHVHLREPGFEYKETIKTGSAAAACGGFTTICCMPNTNPVIDCGKVVKLVNNIIDKDSFVNVLPIGSITIEQKGEKLSIVEEMVHEGIIALSEDGKTVTNSKLMIEALNNAKKYNIPLFSHCEDDFLKNGGQINKGSISNKFNVKGLSNEMEEVIIARDIILNKNINARLHICHVATKDSIKIIKFAKENSINVTCEVTPHHFSLSDEDIKENNGNYKMAPPLRNKKDLEAILVGLKDGTIDIIATDHAPHHIDEKNVPFEKAMNGIVGLETAISLGITNLVKKNILTPTEFIEKLTINPAKLLKIEKGTLSIGKIADLTIIDPNEEYFINASSFKSKSKNTPFNNFKVFGKVKYTIVNGKIILDNEKLL